jgi:2-polyprenyl-3-methyl-5-hydroxy-6-metoxy-1,4-benzoquinol methylase
MYQAEDHYSGDKFSLIKCCDCGLIFTYPRPSIEELSGYYPASYYGDNGIRFHPLLEIVVGYFRKRLASRISNKYPVGGRILDIGSGRGTLLTEMADKGWETIGTEYSKSLAEAVENKFGIQIYSTPNLQDCNFPANVFDIIVCYHVLEHLSDPLGTLFELKRLLNSSGMLILAVPNIEGTIANVSKEHWFANDVPRHLFHFSPQTISLMLEKTGFGIEYFSTMSLEQHCHLNKIYLASRKAC